MSRNKRNTSPPAVPDLVILAHLCQTALLVRDDDGVWYAVLPWDRAPAGARVAWVDRHGADCERWYREGWRPAVRSAQLQAIVRGLLAAHKEKGGGT